MAAVGAAKAELNSKKKLFETIGIWLSTAYIVSALIYWAGTYWWIGLTAGIAAAVAITFMLLKSKGIIKLPTKGK